MATYSYDAFGNTTITGDINVAKSNPYRYAGYRFDDLTGMYYLIGRYYDPSTGRFLSRDPANNLPDYHYVSSNPLKFTDPTGFMKEGGEYGGGGGGTTSSTPGPGGGSMVIGPPRIQTSTFVSLDAIDASYESEVAEIISAREISTERVSSIREIESNGKSSKYEDITSPTSRYHNRRTDVTRKELEANLSEDGWNKSESRDGRVVNYEKNGAKYSIREDAKSTGGPTADYYKPGSKKIDTKIRLGQ